MLQIKVERKNIYSATIFWLEENPIAIHLSVILLEMSSATSNLMTSLSFCHVTNDVQDVPEHCGKQPFVFPHSGSRVIFPGD
jgi:hypothetical protein